MDISIPRYRQSDFEPQIVQKGQRRFTGFDDKILSMYARGMTVRDIQGHLTDIYNVEVSPVLISIVCYGYGQRMAAPSLGFDLSDTEVQLCIVLMVRSHL